MDKCPQINLHVFSYLSPLDQMFHFAFYKKALKKEWFHRLFAVISYVV